MRFLLASLLAITIALGLGGWSAKLAIDGGTNFDSVALGPWRASPLIGTREADPYAKARLAKLAQLTLGGGEGIMFQAEADGEGRRLLLECTYRLTGRTPAARFFTLSAHSDDGRVDLPQSGRPGWLTSNALLRREDNSFEITVGPQARAGNWLATDRTGPYRLTFALYDTPASAITGAAGLEMPAIEREGCSDDG
ncbi:DUF1214 domain-containing protein [Fulvimarina sp. 2208YS6-2-32]|uniref:DUF1214 domain-containing protein n=1 Tax=Fulvimarina uroteuthidis TaxID=3098149 RepID=A0ABU5HZB5_9HYPH|nr:DUF1214 domain-containing protein [Fulvimarina sp. 2208YS6-2-32]MDY8108467.1 DUF1214 domain-containing protein [Fulvimarina sp. 2208YS6-2-32]